MVGVILGCIGTLAKKRKIIGTVGVIQGLYRSYIRILVYICRGIFRNHEPKYRPPICSDPYDGYPQSGT